MMSPARYQEVVEFVEQFSSYVGCSGTVYEHRVGDSDASTVHVEFKSGDMQIRHLFSDAELEYCRLPIEKYVVQSMGTNAIQELIVKCLI